MRAVIHDVLPGNILGMYQSVTGSEYPTLEDFLSKSRTVADRLTLKYKNQQKNSGSEPTNSSANSKFTPYMN